MGGVKPHDTGNGTGYSDPHEKYTGGRAPEPGLPTRPIGKEALIEGVGLLRPPVPSTAIEKGPQQKLPRLLISVVVEEGVGVRYDL